MPTYEYRCESCESEFTAEQRITAAPLEVCTLCGASGVRRLISRSTFVLKGAGFYTTDYARAGRCNANGTDKEQKTDKAAASACASCESSGDCSAAA